MKLKALFAGLLAISLVGTLAAQKKYPPTEDIAGLPRVLIIGDDIANGYIPQVKKLLEGKANVHRPPVNVGGTISSKSQLDGWLGKAKWDLIYFNWGNQDLRYLKSGRQNTPPASYEKNLDEFVKKVKKHSPGATLVFATTTPVPPDVQGDPRKPEDVIIYNETARRVMKQNNVRIIDDLYTFINPKVDYLQRPNDYRFEKEGYRALAERVANTIEGNLGNPSPDIDADSAAAGADTSGEIELADEQPGAAAKSPSLVQIKDRPGLPRVLLIGDSISQGYTVRVREILKSKANVHRPPTNCGGTATSKSYIDGWLGDKQWDVIHFNWGLHDMKYLTSGRQNTPPENYEQNLDELVKKMKAHSPNAILIFASTTPVAETQPGKYPRKAEDVAKYNEIARKVMKDNKVPLIDDLYAVVSPNLSAYLSSDAVHYNSDGCDVLAKAVAESIDYALKIKK